jgi:hypothetical protein
VRLRILQSGHCVFAVICNKVSAQLPKKHLADIKTDNSNKSLLQYRRNIENQQIEDIISRGQDPKSQTKHLKHNSLMLMFVNFHKPERCFELASRVLQLQRKKFHFFQLRSEGTTRQTLEVFPLFFASSTEVEWRKSDGEADKLLYIHLPIPCAEYPTVSKLHHPESSASLQILYIPSKTVCKLEGKNYEQEEHHTVGSVFRTPMA